MPSLVTVSPWQLTLSRETTDRAWGVIRHIDERVLAILTDPGNARSSWQEDAPGLATYLAYRWRVSGLPEHREAAQAMLDAAGELLTRAPLTERLYGGYTGIAWTVSHLIPSLSDDDPGALTEDIDIAVDEAVATWQAPMCYDLIGGLAGLGVQLLERPESAAVDAGLSRVVDHFAASAIPLEGGIAWHTPVELMAPRSQEEWPTGCFNLGVSHGIPGIIGVLSQIAQRGIRTAECVSLLESSVGWFLRQWTRSEHLPIWCTEAQKGPPARISWCYGNLGVSLVLLQAAQAVGGNQTWQQAALDMADACTTGNAWHERHDPGLCHGAAGNAHLYNRLYQATGEPGYLAAMNQWIGRTLDLHSMAHGGSGFRSLVPGTTEWDNPLAFLEGDAGIGLALLGTLSTVEPDWDRVILMQLQPGTVPSASGRHAD